MISFRKSAIMLCMDAPERTVTDAPTRRGRPLDADRTPAILRAVLDLLRDVGYDQLRVQDVAERAGVGLGTIYRRWRTKEALVVDALEQAREIGYDEKFVDTGDPRADLVTTLTNIALSIAGERDVVGFIASVQRDPVVAETFRRNAIAPMRERLRALIAAARGSDEDDAALDTLADLGPALIMFRAAVVGDSHDPEQLAREIADVILSHPRTPD
jgi:AcrR family transcriptional regulator